MHPRNHNFDSSSQVRSSSSLSNPKSGSYSPSRPVESVNKSMKGNILLKYHPSSQIINKNSTIRLIMNQYKKLDITL